MSESVGHKMHRFMTELYPICRSITGDGVRQTLRLIAQHIPLEVREVPSGTPVFDWTVPKEWNIRDAYVKNANGERVIDFRTSNLHVLGYSTPIHARMPLAELKPHLFSAPEHPDWIPYRTSYYTEQWGFCVSDRELRRLPEGLYEVCIDSSLTAGSLTYGECYLPGESTATVLLSCHVCHPSLANDNLSGIAVATQLVETLLTQSKRRYSYRVLFAPATIGAITWLALNDQLTTQIKHGLILSCLGDPGHCTYKRSRQGHAEIDHAATHMLQMSGDKHEVTDFIPYGYDERQYCSPGFNLPVGCFMRTPNGRYPEYHTSADNLELVRPDRLEDSWAKLLTILSVLEGNATLVNRLPKCEPQLGKRGLYATTGGAANRKALEMALLWVLNLSDGKDSLLAIAERASMDFQTVRSAADLLEKAGLLEPISKSDSASN